VGVQQKTAKVHQVPSRVIKSDQQLQNFEGHHRPTYANPTVAYQIRISQPNDKYDVGHAFCSRCRKHRYRYHYAEKCFGFWTVTCVSLCEHVLAYVN